MCNFLSIVIPVYNGEKFLDETIKSILNQTYSNYELIIVNDGSTDNTLTILNSYAKKDERIRIISQANGGPGCARNTGLREIKGDYVFILDADDFYVKSFFQDMVNQAETTDADIVICQCREFSTTKEESVPSYYQLKEQYLPKKKVFSYKNVLDHTFEFCIGWSWDKLYKTSFIKENQLSFQELPNTDDAFFVFTSIVKAKNISIVKKELIYHRTNVAGSTSNLREKHWDSFYTAVISIKNELVKIGKYEELEKAFLNWSMNFCLWNLETVSKASQGLLYNQLKDKWIDELGILKHDCEYYFNQGDYKQICRIKELSYVKFYKEKRNKVSPFSKLMKSFKEIGFLKTIKKILRKIVKRKGNI